MTLQIKKSRIRETKHLSTDADSSRIKQIFARQFYTLYEQKFSNLRQLLALTFPQGFQISKKFGHWTSSGDKKTFNP